MTSIRSDVIVLPPNTLDKRHNSLHSVATGAAAESAIFTWPAVNIVSSTDATPIVLNVGASHGFQVGDEVVVASHTINTNANGVWTVTAKDATHITLGGTTATGGGAGGATGTVNLLESPNKFKSWVTFMAETEDCYIRIGAATGAAATSATNGLLIPAGEALSFYLVPSKDTTVDAFAAAAGTLKWYVSSPPCERERI